jgi:hypothetical protein
MAFKFMGLLGEGGPLLLHNPFLRLIFYAYKLQNCEKALSFNRTNLIKIVKQPP